VRLPYHMIGRGPQRVLALHGWFGHEGFLAAAEPSLDLDRFTYCCPAQRGYGAARELTGSYTLEEVAADALETVDSLQWSEFAVLGHSMGGKVAQRLLLLAPERVLRIVAVTPLPASSVPFDAEGRSLFFGAATDLHKREAIIDFSTGGRLTSTWIRRVAAQSWTTSRAEAFAAYLTSWSQSDFAAQVRGSDTPVRVLVGANDPHLTSELMHATFSSWFTHCEVQVLANAGHYPMDETPIAFATAVERFLSQPDADR
jgi:pimeloyl-ACP methyl ester carboxylesterase